MRLFRLVRLAPVAVVLAAVASSLVLFAYSPAVRAECGTASTPCPTPASTPVNAFLSLDPTTGGANTLINVRGGQFLPNEHVLLYWDPHPVSGEATSDANGNFDVRVTPSQFDSPGVHKLCATVPPYPCADFTLQATPSPSPSPSPTPSESPSPTPIATTTEPPNSSPVASTLTGFDVVSRPPFVFLPIGGAAAVALALGFWLFSILRGHGQPAALPTAAVTHRELRRDYSAGPGTPTSQTPAPPRPPAPQSETSNVEWGPPVEWGTGSGEWGFPEPPPVDDPEEPPRPTD